MQLFFYPNIIFYEKDHDCKYKTKHKEIKMSEYKYFLLQKAQLELLTLTKETTCH